ncbi:UNVERIFIED_CONTAM: hypothetical protein GTU68_005282, partial [Idotea baltica]|nr:hypothetical protein [Idotea baltica]
YDIRSKKIFLKRVHIDGIEEKDLYVGNTVVILSRQLKIVDYADEFTRNEISRRRQRTFAMVKPDAVHRIGEIIDLLQNRKFEVTQMKMVRLTKNQAKKFYEEHSERGFYEELVSYMTSGPVIAMELVGEEAVDNWRQTLGPTDSGVARDQFPDTVRALFGTNKQLNAAHGSDSTSSATRELSFFFGDSGSGKSEIRATALLQNTTCCIVKPHAIKAEHLGKILSAILQEGFEVTALQMVRLDKSEAEEFLEVYKEVLAEYPVRKSRSLYFIRSYPFIK